MSRRASSMRSGALTALSMTSPRNRPAPSSGSERKSELFFNLLYMIVGKFVRAGERWVNIPDAGIMGHLRWERRFAVTAPRHSGYRDGYLAEFLLSNSCFSTLNSAGGGASYFPAQKSYFWLNA